MNAFDMISEPILFAQELRAYSSRAHQTVELIQSLADALLADDQAKMEALHRQMCGIWHDANQSRLSLYSQIKGMRFHVAGGDAFNQYMACQDRVADSLQGLADLLALRRTPFPAGLQDDFRALLAGVVSVSRRTMHMAESLFSETETPPAGSPAQDLPGATKEALDEKSQTRQRETEFARHLYDLEKQLEPVAVMFLDKCRTMLHDVAENAGHAGDHLRLMTR